MSLCRFFASSLLCIVVLYFSSSITITTNAFSIEDGGTIHLDGNEKGSECFERGNTLFNERKYDEAAIEYWKSVLLNEKSVAENDKEYDVTAAFQNFMQCYIIQGKPADGLAFVAVESFRRGQIEMGKTYLEQAMQVDPQNPLALEIKEQYYDVLVLEDDDDDDEDFYADDDDDEDDYEDEDDEDEEDEDDEDDDDDDYDYMEKDDLDGKTPEELYELGSIAFRDKYYEECADLFELSCYKSKFTLQPSCSNAVYCRTMIIDWGYNGEQHAKDMKRITRIVKEETKQFRNAANKKNVTWQRASSCHPHMMLGYPLDNDPVLKRYVTESVAYMDEKMARVSIPDGGAKNTKFHLEPLPDDMPYRHDTPQALAKYREQSRQENFKIKVGFIGSGFNSKAVLYLSQDMFRFFNDAKYEIHIFSIGPEDSPYFIKHGMRDVDWRQRVIDYIGGTRNFHDVQHLANNHVKLAQLIHDTYGIHILIEWDGYARQGERAQGLFALRPCPIQMYHQEYLGTSGALDYVDYLFTDQITSPPSMPQLPFVDNDDDDLDESITIDSMYTEKLIYLPNHFFSKGHAFQDEVLEATYEYEPLASKKQYKYTQSKGSPQENKCMKPHHYRKDVSMVFCNFNKFLKNNPDTLKSWINILQQVPNSILCLLENPTAGVPYLRKFVYEYIYETHQNSTTTTTTDPNKLGDELNERIMFLPWEKNPFDHQRRNFDFCNINLDSYPYNGHTTAQDSLYAGVPIVTRSDGYDMASRVTTSANIVLGLDQELNAYGGIAHYEQLAIELATNKKKFNRVRNKLIDSTLQRHPMHPYWDVERYVKNFENGLSQAYQNFLNGNPPQHIFVKEEQDDDDDEEDDEEEEEEEEEEHVVVEEQPTEEPEQEQIIVEEEQPQVQEEEQATYIEEEQEQPIEEEVPQETIISRQHEEEEQASQEEEELEEQQHQGQEEEQQQLHQEEAQQEQNVEHQQQQQQQQEEEHYEQGQEQEQQPVQEEAGQQQQQQQQQQHQEQQQQQHQEQQQQHHQEQQQQHQEQVHDRVEQEQQQQQQEDPVNTKDEL